MKKTILTSLLCAGTLTLHAAEPDKANLDAFHKARAALAADPHRPLYHFTAPGGMIHDPAGLCFWQGRYHLFYLFNARGVVKSARGHAVSDDLVHWQDLPMLPQSIRGGTGQAWADDDRVILGYGGVNLATASDPLLTEWTEHPNNPVIKGADNYLWREDDFYYLTYRKEGPVGTGPLRYHTARAALEIRRSKDLTNWEDKGLLFQDTLFTEVGDDASCNSFLPIGNGKHLLLFYSHKRSSQYYIGTYNRETFRFTPEKHGRMNYGTMRRGSLDCPTGFIDPKGRCVGMWNVSDNMEHNEDLSLDRFNDSDNVLQKGWSYMATLPRKLSLNEGSLLEPLGKGTSVDKLGLGRIKGFEGNPLGIEPIEELKSLRFNPVKIRDLTIPANGETVLNGVRGKAIELDVVIDPMNAREIGLNVLRSPDGREQTTVTLYMHGWFRDPTMRDLAIDVSRASLDPRVDSRAPEIGPLQLQKGELVHLRIFIDRSIVEVFANGRQCLTLRTYPTLRDSNGVSIFARGNEAKIVSLDAYQMRSIWPELKTQEGK